MTVEIPEITKVRAMGKSPEHVTKFPPKIRREKSRSKNRLKYIRSRSYIRVHQKGQLLIYIRSRVDANLILQQSYKTEKKNISPRRDSRTPRGRINAYVTRIDHGFSGGKNEGKNRLKSQHSKRYSCVYFWECLLIYIGSQWTGILYYKRATKGRRKNTCLRRDSRTTRGRIDGYVTRIDPGFSGGKNEGKNRLKSLHSKRYSRVHFRWCLLIYIRSQWTQILYYKKATKATLFTALLGEPEYSHRRAHPARFDRTFGYL